MEEWKEIFKGKIPKATYITKITHGEETGLVIELLSRYHKVCIFFGEVKAIRVLDEGIVQEGVYSDTQIEKYRVNKFENVIYEVTNGEFKQQIEECASGFAEVLDLKHYIIITLSFNIDIVSEWEPSIEVVTLKNQKE
ncbi:hypothetical protein [Anaerosporobacter faecicola]|uniref:hypothetical protein n=1 Tax=Anaerosporobacter faecicola TaxID=2718714 RepID=UPI001439535D|nr:hypothetical protein [Anaerosporobacter faecicola]